MEHQANHCGPTIYWLGCGSNNGMYDADGTRPPPREHFCPDPCSMNLPRNTGHLQVAVKPSEFNVQGAVIQPAKGSFEQVVTGA